MGKTTTEESPLAKNQELILSWIGACLLNLQNCERLVRAILANHEFVGPIDALQQARMHNQKALKGDSLGTNVQKLFGSYFQKETGKKRESDSFPDNITVPHMRFKVSVVLEDEDFRNMKKELDSLVQLRNKLTHHFVEMFNITTIEGSEAALSYLSQSNEKICECHALLLGYAQEVEGMAVRAESTLVS